MPTSSGTGTGPLGTAKESGTGTGTIAMGTECCSGEFSDTLRLLTPRAGDSSWTNYGGSYAGCCNDCSELDGTYDLDIHSKSRDGDAITWLWRSSTFTFCSGDDVYTGQWEAEVVENRGLNPTACSGKVRLVNPDYIDDSSYPNNQYWNGCDDPTLPYWYGIFDPEATDFCDGNYENVTSAGGYSLCVPAGTYLGEIKNL